MNVGLNYVSSGHSQHQIDVELGYLLRFSQDYIRLDQALSQPIDRQFVNVGKVRTNGYELSMDYRWKNRVRAGLNLTYQQIIDQQERLTSTNLTGTTTSPNFNFGFRIPNIPYLFGNFNVDYRFKQGGGSNTQFTLGYNLNYVEEYFLTPNQLGANNQDNIPRQLAHNFSASYAMQDGKYNLSLQINNFTDAALFDNFLLPKPGRAFFLNFRYFLDKPVL